MAQHNSTLEGKKVLILGASSGIGLATAKAAQAAGAMVTMVSGNQVRLDAASAQVPGADSFVVDLGKEAEIRAFFATAGSFDHMMYCAGENLRLYKLADTDLAAARAFLEIRVWGVFAAVKYGSSHIAAGGSITLTGGVAGARPGKGWVLAAGICSMIEGLTRAMAVELAPLRVNCVVPGVVRTPLWDSMPEAERAQLYQMVGDGLPVERVGEAEDLARTYCYLMTQEWCTGQCLTVDGGGVLV